MRLKVPCAEGRTIAVLAARYRGVDPRITDANFPCSRRAMETLDILYPSLLYEGRRASLEGGQILDALALLGHRSLDAAALLALGLENKEPHVAFAQTYKDPASESEFVIWVSNGYASLAAFTHPWGPITRVPAIRI